VLSINLEEVMEEPNESEMLFLRRNLSNLKDGKNEQRENIFHSRSTIQGTVCSLIIDGESCANTVSLGMVEKPNLHATAHPHPNNLFQTPTCGKPSQTTPDHPSNYHQF